MYVDEAGIDQCLYREYARAPHGQKVVTKVSGRKFKRTNIVAGICRGEWIAPLEYTGTTDSTLFEFQFESCLLREIDEDSVIILDNASFYRKSSLPNLALTHGSSVLFLHPILPT